MYRSLNFFSNRYDHVLITEDMLENDYLFDFLSFFNCTFTKKIMYCDIYILRLKIFKYILMVQKQDKNNSEEYNHMFYSINSEHKIYFHFLKTRSCILGKCGSDRNFLVTSFCSY